MPQTDKCQTLLFREDFLHELGSIAINRRHDSISVPLAFDVAGLVMASIAPSIRGERCSLDGELEGIMSVAITIYG